MIGGESYFRLKPDSALLEQLEKAAPDHMLEKLLLRSKLQTMQKRKAEPPAPDSDISLSYLTPSGLTGAGEGRGGRRGFESSSASSSLGGASPGSGAAAPSATSAISVQEIEVWRRQVEEMQETISRVKNQTVQLQRHQQEQPMQQQPMQQQPMQPLPQSISIQQHNNQPPQSVQHLVQQLQQQQLLQQLQQQQVQQVQQVQQLLQWQAPNLHQPMPQPSAATTAQQLLQQLLTQNVGMQSTNTQQPHMHMQPLHSTGTFDRQQIMEQLAVLRGKLAEETDKEARVQLSGEISRCEFKLSRQNGP